MKKKTISVYSLSLLLLTACEKGVPVMGVDSSGRVQNGEISQERYSQELGKLVEQVNAETVPALERQSPNKKWSLRTVVVGLGLRTEVGVGPYKVGAEPRLRLAFTKDEKAPIP